ncbi:DMT family transporter [Clostridium cochlearium]|uniref:Drug/metabolite transporter n=1 Tax=Clostridium cochlearium TaxID=1494 RepID=A0A2X2W6S0_CLOCO|nr:DMT family transporter [Clostridium cochlearium]SQB35117.1 drug/metabolite transporter [Clostridium cochlearium]
MKKNNKLVYIAAISYALITGLSFLFTKIALSISNPFDILAHRFTSSFIVVLILILFKLVKINYNMERIKKIIPLALLYPLMFFAFQTFGLQYASSSEAGILLASSPVFTLILARFFLNEKTNLLQKISIIISVLGVIYITLMKSSSFEFNNIKGIILLILSALSFSGYSVMAKILTKDFTSTELSFVMIIISFICFNTIAISKHLINGTLHTFITPIFNFKFVIAIIYLGVLSSLVTSLLTNYILSKIEASKMSVFSNLGTVISIVAGVIFLKEEIFYYHIIGSILIVGGVIGTNFLDNIK